MVLWVDSYRPKGLNNLDIHPTITETLRKLVASGDTPHLLFYGPSGAGKKTRIMAFLRELFGPGVEKVRIVQRVVETKSKKLEISSLTSPHHIELNPSDAGRADTIVVQDVIKDIAQTHSVTAKAMQAYNQQQHGGDDMNDTTSTTASQRILPSFKVVVLHEVDRLSTDAQHGLRRTMEQYTKTCRLILCSESASRVTAPLLSRCLLIRVPSPQDEQIHQILQHVILKENIKISPSLIIEIVAQADGNMRKALLSLEASCLSSLGPSPTLKLPDWETIIHTIIHQLLTKQDPSQLLAIRAHLYQLITNCIPPDVILQKMILILSQKCDPGVAHSIIRWGAYYDPRLGTTSKSIIHLEAFIAKAMSAIALSNGQ